MPVTTKGMDPGLAPGSILKTKNTCMNRALQQGRNFGVADASPVCYPVTMKRILISFALCALSACATITADSDQRITVTTTPPGAHCVLKNGIGMWEIAQTPGEVKVGRSFSPLAITCVSPKAGEGTATLESGTRNRAYGNILLLGVPAVVDAGTGAGYEYTPAEVNITLMLANAAPVGK